MKYIFIFYNFFIPEMSVFIAWTVQIRGMGTGQWGGGRIVRLMIYTERKKVKGTPPTQTNPPLYPRMSLCELPITFLCKSLILV